MTLQIPRTTTEMPTNLLIQRFPDLRIEILNYYQKSSVFRQICSDYALIVSWLKQNPRDECSSSMAQEHAIELLKELGNEARDFIKRQSSDLWR